MLASIFVADGVRALLHPDAPAAAAQRVTDRVGPWLQKIDPRIPTEARTLVRIKAAGDVVAGLALATGRATRPAAALLAAGLVPKTLIDTPPVRGQQAPFLRNLALLGGLLLATADTEGRPNLRYRTSHAVDRSQRSVKRAVRTARRDAKIAALSASAARKLPG